MIIVTGGAGFIGSAIVAALNARGIEDIIIVDRLGSDLRWKNLVNLTFADYVDKEVFLQLVDENRIAQPIKAVFHMGACSDTTETDADYLIKNNFEYTKMLARWAVENKVRFIYASSAATYGDGSQGFVDNEKEIEKLRPLNMYGYSKQLFDLWARNTGILEKIAGLKYFNVFGPNEYHKANMRSFVLKAFEQIQESGKVRLFKSGDPKYKDGEYVRDFIYIKDAVDMTLYFLDNQRLDGLYNIGTGEARTWNDMVKACFAAMNKEPKIEFIDMPDNLKNQYQYFTQADITKLKKTGYKKPLTTLESAIKDYIQNYLKESKYLEG
jgi:ADP-L-glycero-D-manno-heptose 6-epimerase